MQPDVRRHIDGSIDYSFYRRRAARQRRLAKRLIFRRCWMLMAKAVQASAAAIKTRIPQGYRPLWLERA